MSSINKVFLMGRLGRDPELRSTSNGERMFADFSIATGNSWVDKVTNEKRSNVEWHNCIVFDQNIVEYCKKINKGDKVFVEGELKTRTIEGQETNSGKQKIQRTQIVVKKIDLLQRSGQSSDFNEFNDEDDLKDIPPF